MRIFNVLSRRVAFPTVFFSSPPSIRQSAPSRRMISFISDAAHFKMNFEFSHDISDLLGPRLNGFKKCNTALAHF